MMISTTRDTMVSLIYVSSAVELFSPPGWNCWLCSKHPGRNNTHAVHITGMLLYKDGNFMQVIEGQETAVRKGALRR